MKRCWKYHWLNVNSVTQRVPGVTQRVTAHLKGSPSIKKGPRGHIIYVKSNSEAVYKKKSISIKKSCRTKIFSSQSIFLEIFSSQIYNRYIVRFHEIQAVYQIFLSIRMKKYLFSLARLVLVCRRQSYVFNDFRCTENTVSSPFQRTKNYSKHKCDRGAVLFQRAPCEGFFGSGSIKLSICIGIPIVMIFMNFSCFLDGFSNL